MHIKDLTAAPATPVVLTILSEGESYGYEILKRVRQGRIRLDRRHGLSAVPPAWAARVPDDRVANSARRSPPQLLLAHRARPGRHRKAAALVVSRDFCADWDVADHGMADDDSIPTRFFMSKERS